jgi:hypothetical protein
MAMPPPFSPPPQDESTSGMAPPGETVLNTEDLKRLRELRAEMLDLQAVLNSVRKGQASTEDYAKYLEGTMKDIAELVEVIQDGDTIRRIKNTWEQMSTTPLLVKPEGEFDAQTQLHYLDLLDEQINRVIFLVGALTIPSRLNDWLAKARPGYYIPFHLVFEDELPNFEDRQRLLNYLAWSPEVIQAGIVDVGSGLIYRYNPNPRARWVSIGLLTSGFILTTGVVIGSVWLPVQGWPLSPGNLSMMIASWAAVLAGILVHVGVGSLKSQRNQGSLPPVLSLGDLPLIIDARLGQFLVKIFMALAGLYALIFTTGTSSLTLLSAFLVGYSLDSFLEVFSASVEQRAAAQVAALKSQVGPPGT